MPFLNGRAVSNGYYISGLKGNKGNPGKKGQKGDYGDTGIQGPTGAQGINGVTGSRGSTGSQGSTGLQGLTGAGIQGETGIPGLDGLDGFNGEDGSTGIQGITGPAGLGMTGLQGTQGATGLSGGTGAPLVILTSTVSISNTATETTILTTNASTGYLGVGTQVRFKFRAGISYARNTGNLTIRMYIGSNAGQTVQLLQNNANVSTSYCGFEGEGTIRTTGTSGTFITTGEIWVVLSETTSWNGGQGGSTTTTVNTTATNPVLKMTAQWDTADVDNILNVQNASIEAI